MLNEIKKASQGKLVFCFVGVGAAFSKKNVQTSLIIAKNGTTILVDVGSTIPLALYEKGIDVSDFDYYHITHSHADHIGGFEELLLTCRYLLQKKPVLIITSEYEKILWEQSLKGGCEYTEAGKLSFKDLMIPLRPKRLSSGRRERYKIEINGIHLEIFRTAHIPTQVKERDSGFWSTGLLVDEKVLFTGDMRFDPSLFDEFVDKPIETIFHDCQLYDPGTVHASYEELKTLVPSQRGKMWLTHYNDTFENFRPLTDGFLGFAQPWKIYSW